MNNRIKEIANETLQKVPIGNKNPDKWIDEYLVEFARAIIFECSDVVRKTAKDWEGDKEMILKSTAVDVLDNFGL